MVKLCVAKEAPPLTGAASRRARDEKMLREQAGDNRGGRVKTNTETEKSNAQIIITADSRCM